MRLVPTVVPGWPKLAWVASFVEGSEEIRVLHGPMVETSPDWIVEAVWAGDFQSGAFDLTDLVFGTGIRLRDNRAVFVSSGTPFDRLVYYKDQENWFVGNSFPALLARKI